VQKGGTRRPPLFLTVSLLWFLSLVILAFFLSCVLKFCVDGWIRCMECLLRLSSLVLMRDRIARQWIASICATGVCLRDVSQLGMRLAGLSDLRFIISEFPDNNLGLGVTGRPWVGCEMRADRW
jgi:hypothetical protein